MKRTLLKVGEIYAIRRPGSYGQTYAGRLITTQDHQYHYGYGSNESEKDYTPTTQKIRHSYGYQIGFPVVAVIGIYPFDDQIKVLTDVDLSKVEFKRGLQVIDGKNFTVNLVSAREIIHTAVDQLERDREAVQQAQERNEAITRHAEIRQAKKDALRTTLDRLGVSSMPEFYEPGKLSDQVQVRIGIEYLQTLLERAIETGRDNDLAAHWASEDQGISVDHD